MIITLAGDNKHQMKAEQKRLISEFTSKHGALAVERYEAGDTETEHILSTIAATSLLSPRKLVVIEGYENNKTLTEQTEKLLADTPDDTTVLIVIDKLDKRVAYGKLLKSKSDFREFNTLSPQDLVQWVIVATKDKQGSIDRATAQHLIEYIGTNQARIANELDKLLLADTTITKALVEEHSEKQPSSSVFDLLDAGFRGQTQKTLDLYEEQRRQQVEPLAIMGMIGWQLHILAIVKAAKNKTPQQIAKDAGVHPFVVQKSLSLVKNMTLAKLRRLVHEAVELEVALKNRAMHADDAVKHYLVSL